MALTRITKGVIKPNENYDTHNINSTGIITAVGANFSGNVSVGGVLTYEDVTSVDSIGVITARAGLVSPNADIDDFISVGTNIHLGNAGVITATSFSGSGANLTGIDATAIKDTNGNVKIQAQASGAVYTGIHTFNSGAEVGSNIKLGNAGVITATSFVGDGSDLTNLPAGLGTALSATATSPLNKMYYTNQVLGVPSSITVDVPTSASKAYTQYADIKVESSADLIIAEGDDLIPDVLGLADFGTFGGGASAGRIRVNSISNAANDGSPTVQKGLVVTGVTTSTTFSGSGASLTNLPSAQLTGALPAIDGSNLTGITQTTINNNANNRVITGSGTANTLNGESSLTYDGSKLFIGNTSFSNLNTSADDLVIGTESSGVNAGLSIITHSGNIGHLLFGDQDGGTRGGFRYQHSVDNLQGYSGGSAPFNLKSNALGLHENYPIANSITIRGAATDDTPLLVLKRHTDGAQSDGEIIGKIQFMSNENNVDSGNHQPRAEIHGVTVSTSGAAKLDFYTVPNSTTTPIKRMTLNQEGQLTVPNNPFVMVHINTNSNQQTTGSQLIIPWDTIHGRSTSSNVGSYFNTSNHRFTAPIDGRYLFVVSLNIRGDNIMYHRINGTNVHGAEYRLTEMVWDHIDSSIIYDMNANDYYDMTSQLFNGSGHRWNSGGNGNYAWDCLSIYLLG